MKTYPDSLKIPDSEMETMVKTRRRMRPASPPSLRSIKEQGPIILYQHCSFTTQKYRDNYDGIKWNK